MLEPWSALAGAVAGVFGALFGAYRIFPQKSDCVDRHDKITETFQQLIEEHDADIKEFRKCLLELKTELQNYMRTVNTILVLLTDRCQDSETRRIVMEHLKR